MASWVDFNSGTSPFQTAIVLSLLFLLLVIATDLIDGHIQRRRLRGIPLIDDGSRLSPVLRWTRSKWDLKAAYSHAYQTYTKQGLPWAARLPHNGYCVILPWESSRGWRNLPRDHVSFMHMVNVVNGMDYHHSDVTAQLPVDAIYKYSNRESSLRQFEETFLRSLSDFLPGTFPIGENNAWYEVNTMEAMFRMMMKVAASFLIGPEFATDDDFVTLTLSYTSQINAVTTAVYSYPRILRPLVWQMAPACRGIRSSIAALKKKLIPEIRARVNRARSGEKKEGLSLLDVLIDTALQQDNFECDARSAEAARMVDQLAQHTMFFFFDAAGPIAMLTSLMLYRIMATPIHAAPLRAEIKEALNATGSEWRFEILSRMPRLESFSREVLRLHVPLVWSLGRQILKPVTIKSLELTFQPGDLIATPVFFMHTDPDLYPDATTFDPDRFFDPVSKKCVPRAATATDTYLTFGQGTCACPGRTLGMRAVLITLAEILMRYEVEFADGRQDFPSNVLTSGFNMCDPTVMMRIRKREFIKNSVNATNP
ncbi:cytochrome P450 [Aspergillus saccharolyticus JOP 1030-1]|uniref:Cytochrome P450 n=1 Tax=Aspergillus saccharolyticus JOP 1030-1 TaxID=1450539 RepID=A0A318ZMG4_9EURO|nr:cytochrome P450 [Aspergillus saccharolyticus JOP 1030-1]PYH48811.1 cytochrome P450 [Aspergillus saccharolyticus JOP 1030-1]